MQLQRNLQRRHPPTLRHRDDLQRQRRLRAGNHDYQPRHSHHRSAGDPPAAHDAAVRDDVHAVQGQRDMHDADEDLPSHALGHDGPDDSHADVQDLRPHLQERHDHPDVELLEGRPASHLDYETQRARYPPTAFRSRRSSTTIRAWISPPYATQPAGPASFSAQRPWWFETSHSTRSAPGTAECSWNSPSKPVQPRPKPSPATSRDCHDRQRAQPAVDASAGRYRWRGGPAGRCAVVDGFGWCCRRRHDLLLRATALVHYLGQSAAGVRRKERFPSSAP